MLDDFQDESDAREHPLDRPEAQARLRSVQLRHGLLQQLERNFMERWDKTQPWVCDTLSDMMMFRYVKMAMQDLPGSSEDMKPEIEGQMRLLEQLARFFDEQAIAKREPPKEDEQ